MYSNDGVFRDTEASQFHGILIIIGLSTCANGVLFRKFFLLPIRSRLVPVFSSVKFSVSGFMWRSLIHFVLSFVQEDKYRFIWILLHEAIQFDKHHILKM